MPIRLTASNHALHRDPCGSILEAGLRLPGHAQPRLWPVYGASWRSVVVLAIQQLHAHHVKLPEVRAGRGGRLLLSADRAAWMADRGSRMAVEDTPYLLRDREMNSHAYLIVFFGMLPPGYADGDAWITFEPGPRKHRRVEVEDPEEVLPFFGE
jgi:hypothetical protein